MFQTTRQPWWLAVGMLYASGKYLFLVQSVAGQALEEESSRDGEDPGAARADIARREAGFPGSFSPSRVLRRLAGMVGHADVRWHLWIVLGLAGRLDLALIFYAAYFPLRALAGGVGKVVAHA